MQLGVVRKIVITDWIIETNYTLRTMQMIT